MKNHPLLLSILLGVILLLIIGGISISARLSATSKQYKENLAEYMKSQKMQDILQEEKDALLKSTVDLKERLKQKEAQIESLQSQNQALTDELEKVKVMKEKLEDDLQEMLLKSKSTRK